MKVIKLSMVVLLGLSLFLSNCKNEDDNNNSNNLNNPNNPNAKVIDSKLIGDWIQVKRSYYDPGKYYHYGCFNIDEEIYIFTSNTFSKGNSYKNWQNYWIDKKALNPDMTIKAYSENGCVYSYDDNTLLFMYTTSAYPSYIDADYKYFKDNNMQGMYLNVHFYQKDAENGKVISITLPDSNEKLFFVSSLGDYLKY